MEGAKRQDSRILSITLVSMAKLWCYLATVWATWCWVIVEVANDCCFFKKNANDNSVSFSSTTWHSMCKGNTWGAGCSQNKHLPKAKLKGTYFDNAPLLVCYSTQKRAICWYSWYIKHKQHKQVQWQWRLNLSSKMLSYSCNELLLQKVTNCITEI
jgi:hypothetical protein